MSVNLLKSQMSAGGAYGISGSLTMRFKTDQVTPGKRTATIQCDSAFVEVDWGDGTVERLKGTAFTHEYEEAGTYDVVVSTIGASRFTPRYAAPHYFNLLNPAGSSREGGQELIALLDGSTWRCGSDLNSAFFRTSLTTIDSSCQGVFDRVTGNTGIGSTFAYCANLESLYEGFNLPLVTGLDNAFTFSGLQSWPSSGTCLSARSAWRAFQGTQLSSWSVQNFMADTMTSNQAHLNTWQSCPIVQGGMVDNIKIRPNTNNMGGWCNGWLVTTPPAMTIASTVSSIVNSFANCPNLTTIPKEAVDCRARNGPVSWNSGFGSGCPNLTTIDFTYWPNMTGGINSMSQSITTWIFPPEPMPYLFSTYLGHNAARLDVASTGALLAKCVESINLYPVTPGLRCLHLAGGGFYTGPLPGNPFLGFQYNPSFPADLPQSGSGCAPIQDWTPQMIADKNTLVAAGIQVTYQDLSL